MDEVQWYQSPTTVTASIKLKSLGIAPNNASDITTHFEEQYCALCLGGSPVWECHLAGNITPEKCKLIPGRVRLELKMKKADAIQWTDFQVEGAAKTTKKSSITTPSDVPVAMPTPEPAKAYVPEDLTYVKHLPHDFYEKGGDVVHVRVSVGDMKGKVKFYEQSAEIQFQTSDAKFLRTHTGSRKSTTFVWNISLFDLIKPAESSFTVKPTHLELQLKKATPARWKMLEKRQSSLGISTANQNTDDMLTFLNDLDVSDSELTTPTSSNDDVTMTSSKTPTNEKQRTTTTTIRTDQSNRSKTIGQPTASATTAQGQVRREHPYGGGHNKTSQTTPTTYTAEYVYPPSRIPPSAIESSNPSYKYTQLRRPSLTGLCNLGNTCFMNSVVQCLSNTHQLRDYFIEGHFLADINKQNPLGFQGELAKCFSGIIRKLWSAEHQYLSPKKLKSVIATRSSHFGGDSQHDSHEFMSYLLDGLHEDLNRIKEKPQTAPIESDDHSDTEVAMESWKVHLLRNDSYLVDLFQGQFKSTLVCPMCSKVSVTFDPFMSLSVPIPRNLRHLPVVFVPKDPDIVPRQYILKLPQDANLELLKASVARKTGIFMTQLRVFEAYNGKFQTLLSSNRDLISSIKDDDIIIVSEVLSEKEAKGHVAEFNVIQRLQVPPFPTKCDSCGKQAQEGRKLQRCSKCKAVGYCNQKCQKNDWTFHKDKCRQGRPSPIGLPFVVSLPAKDLTFSNLSAQLEKFARRSVEYTRTVVENPESIQENPESMQENPESMQENPEGMQENPESIQENPEGIQENPESIQENPEGIQENPEGIQECNTRRRELKPMYQLTPVDRYGDSLEGVSYLDNEGDQLLSIDSKFLAMDWRNNPKDEDCVVVTPKLSMDYRQDTSSSSGSSSAGPLSLSQCLELFTEPESLSKDEAWYCPKCKEHREATKQISVWRLPKILIIQLKKFSFRNNYIWRDKINKLVSFPLRGLDMSPYMLGEAANQISSEHPPIYDLYATVNHYGSVYIGHYVAFVHPPSPVRKEKGKNEWLCYDDEKVYLTDEDSVVNKDAYMLFYRRRE